MVSVGARWIDGEGVWICVWGWGRGCCWGRLGGCSVIGRFWLGGGVVRSEGMFVFRLGLIVRLDEGVVRMVGGAVGVEGVAGIRIKNNRNFLLL